MATKLLPLAGAATALYFFEPLRSQLNTLTHHPALSGWLLASALTVLAVSAVVGELVVLVQFAYNCFLRPLGKHHDQKGRLDAFYQQQASVRPFPASLRQENID
jgi:betaine lipid synthase